MQRGSRPMARSPALAFGHVHASADCAGWHGGLSVGAARAAAADLAGVRSGRALAPTRRFGAPDGRCAERCRLRSRERDPDATARSPSLTRRATRARTGGVQIGALALSVAPTAASIISPIFVSRRFHVALSFEHNNNRRASVVTLASASIRSDSAEASPSTSAPPWACCSRSSRPRSRSASPPAFSCSALTPCGPRLSPSRPPAPPGRGSACHASAHVV